MHNSLNNLSLKWIYLAWVPLVPAVVIMGSIGAIVQGDPEPFIENKLGFGDIGIFALGLYGLGLLLAVLLLHRNLESFSLSLKDIGLTGSITPLAAVYILAAIALDSLLLFPGAQWLTGQFGIPFFWDGSGSFNFASGLDIVTAFIAAVLISPVAEEIMFRGYLLNALLGKGFNRFTAALLAAIIFASVHVFFGPGFIFYIILWAMIPTYLYLKFKSLYPAILFHLLNNLLAYMVIPLFS